ncbi:hypothetical protein MNBD_CHLOROFLEXI01-4550 [hydrothermal vent metagenome]|uniref:DUF2281 domain-containing protein n=1 Tax=hydrothermal vent metagenome TaxID=652676 RepID=A0A3B0VIT6_9ZZZZ
MLKETLWREIDSLPPSRLKTLLDFARFLQFMEEQKSEVQKVSSRIPGLDADTTWVSDDFDNPLPDSFWFGTSVDHETAS